MVDLGTGIIALALVVLAIVFGGGVHLRRRRKRREQAPEAGDRVTEPDGGEQP